VIVMTPNNCDCGYSCEDIEKLQRTIDKKLSKKINAFHSSQRFDLGGTINKDLVFKVAKYKELLEKIKNCDTCFKDYKIEDIFSVIKNKLNEL